MPNQSIDLRQTSIVDRVRLFDYLTSTGESISPFSLSILLAPYYTDASVFGCDPSDNLWKVATHTATYPSLESYYESRTGPTPPIYRHVTARTIPELFKEQL